MSLLELCKHFTARLPAPAAVLVATALICGCDSGAEDKKPPTQTADKDTPAAKPEKPQAPAEEVFLGHVCVESELMSCYDKFKKHGSIDGTVTVDIAKDGSIHSVSYTGSAPKPVSDCMVELVRAKPPVPKFTGSPMQALCNYSGSRMMGGGGMMMWSPAYKRLPDNALEATPPEDAKTPTEAKAEVKEQP